MSHATGVTCTTGGVAELWANTVLRAISAPHDVRTLADWAEVANLSVSTLRTRCYLCGVQPRSGLAFVRVLRAVLQARQIGCTAGDLLDVRDPRTLKTLVARAGGGVLANLSVEQYLTSQRFLNNGRALSKVMELLGVEAAPK